MNHKRLWVSATIIACVILVLFAFTAPHTQDIPEDLISDTTISVPSVAIRDSYKKGVHTITGSVRTPNACATVSAEATPLEVASSTTGILIAITMSQDSGICLQRAEDVRFTATIPAPANLPITASVNGATASTTDL